MRYKSHAKQSPRQLKRIVKMKNVRTVSQLVVEIKSGAHRFLSGSNQFELELLVSKYNLWGSGIGNKTRMNPQNHPREQQGFADSDCETSARMDHLL